MSEATTAVDLPDDRAVGHAVLSIEGLTTGYDTAVVRRLDLEVREAEVVALLGANGAGKTTTLRAISGILPATDGRILFHGTDLERYSISERARLGIAHVPDNRGLFFGLTVDEHLRLSHRGETMDRDAAFEYFPQLARIKGRRAGLLSGGEQQMLAMARALARRPKLLLLDELSLGLAPIIVERLLPVVRQYANDSGCGVLLVEQHVHLALGVADRGYVLSHGELALHDDAAVLRADRELVLAGYFGERGSPDASPPSGAD